MRDRAWTLLLIGEENGIVGGLGRTFEKHPAHYERVTVIERDPALARIAELEGHIEFLEARELGWVRSQELEAENQRLLRHLNRMNDIMCDALASTALLGGGE